MKRVLFAVAVLLLLGGGAEAQIISTVAGGGTSGLGDGGAATDCGLHNPVGIALDAAGNIYIGDRDNNRIRKINTSGIITTIAGTGTAGFSGDGGPATDAKIYAPYGLCVDASGNVYFTDNGNDRIRKISTVGIITTIAGGGTGGLGDGGSATDAKLFGPAGVVTDNIGNIYISDGANNRVRKVDAMGVISTIAGGGSSMGSGIPATDASLGIVYSITIDVSGNIYVGEQTKYRVLKITPSGMLTIVAGTGTGGGYNGDDIPATTAQIRGAFGIAVDGSGNIYIGEGTNHRVRKINTFGIISTIAGNGTSGFSGDGGLAIDATFRTPLGIAMTSGGNLLVADFSNDRIRSISNVVSVDAVNKKEAEINIYPNPSNGNFTVDASSSINENYSVIITDMVGRLVHQADGITNSLLPLWLNAPTGVYVLTVVTAQEKISKKINIINK